MINQTGEERQIIIRSAMVCVILAVLGFGISFFIAGMSWTWCISLIIGYFASLACFLKTSYIYTKILFGDIIRPRKALVGNSITNGFIYLVCCAINLLIPIFSIWMALIGMLIIKVIIIILFGIMPKNKGGESVDNQRNDNEGI